jgi:predicted DNA-binding transcriptional regulator YafY
MIDKLREAIETGKTLNIRYFGGSTPGAERQIIPLKIDGNLVRARCSATGETKNFRIDRIELLSDGTPSAVAAQINITAPPTTFTSLTEFAEYYQKTLHSIGWVVQHTDHALSLHRTRQNGTILKSFDIEISYTPTEKTNVWLSQQFI